MPAAVRPAPTTAVLAAVVAARAPAARRHERSRNGGESDGARRRLTVVRAALKANVLDSPLGSAATTLRR